jgi:hypothetical protein
VLDDGASVGVLVVGPELGALEDGAVEGTLDGVLVVGAALGALVVG